MGLGQSVLDVTEVVELCVVFLQGWLLAGDPSKLGLPLWPPWQNSLGWWWRCPWRQLLRVPWPASTDPVLEHRAQPHAGLSFGLFGRSVTIPLVWLLVMLFVSSVPGDSPAPPVCSRYCLCPSFSKEESGVWLCRSCVQVSLAKWTCGLRLESVESTEERPWVTWERSGVWELFSQDSTRAAFTLESACLTERWHGVLELDFLYSVWLWKSGRVQVLGHHWVGTGSSGHNKTKQEIDQPSNQDAWSRIVGSLVSWIATEKQSQGKYWHWDHNRHYGSNPTGKLKIIPTTITQDCATVMVHFTEMTPLARKWKSPSG